MWTLTTNLDVFVIVCERALVTGVRARRSYCKSHKDADVMDATLVTLAEICYQLKSRRGF